MIFQLQEAFVAGKLKPGMNIVEETKTFANNIVSDHINSIILLIYSLKFKAGLKQKLVEFQINLSWIETLDCTNNQAPLAPELAAQLAIQRDKRQNQMQNNKKLAQFTPDKDPVLNDFQRESGFYRQAQASVLEAFPKLKNLGLSTLRPDDYFAEMAKSDVQMQKIRTHLMQKQVAKQKSERVKQLRTQRKEGKMLQVQAKLERQKEKKTMLDQVKKVRKGQSKDLGFLDGKKSKKVLEKRKMRDKKFGFGGKKKGSKMNTKDSAGDISEYRKPKKVISRKSNKNSKPGNKRLGKSRRIQNKAKGKR